MNSFSTISLFYTFLIHSSNSALLMEYYYVNYFFTHTTGAGKGTQCTLLSKNHGWAHLSAGDLLRAERKKSGSKLADIINSNISAGKIVPSEITTQLIKNAMVELRRTQGQIKFLIDGFPRSEGNVTSWQEVVGDAAVLEYVLFFECPYDILTSRLLERGKTSGRSDDSLVSEEKSLPIYNIISYHFCSNNYLPFSNTTGCHSKTIQHLP